MAFYKVDIDREGTHYRCILSEHGYYKIYLIGPDRKAQHMRDGRCEELGLVYCAELDDLVVDVPQVVNLAELFRNQVESIHLKRTKAAEG